MAFTNYSVASTPPSPAGTPCPGSSLCWNYAAEGGIRATPDGQLFGSSENGLGAGTMAWHSTDGGHHFTSLPSPNDVSVGSTSTGQEAGVEPGGGDTDIAVANAKNAQGNYNVYVASLTLASVDVSTSTDNGASWTLNPAAALPIDDRPWIAATGASKVCISYLTAPGILAPEAGFHVQCSNDAGATFTQVANAYDGSAAGQGCTLESRSGNLQFDPNNPQYLYAVAVCGTTADATNPNPTGLHVVVVATSTDGGQTFTDHVAYLDPNTTADFQNQFPNLAVDQGGNVYVTWSDDSNVFYAYSTDHGQTWSAPVQVSQNGTSLMPWLAAGDAGKIDLAYYHSTYVGDPQSAPAAAGWDVEMAQNLTATTAGSSFSYVEASPVIHYGPVCQGGAGCTADRDLYDDFGIIASPTTGQASILYSDDQYWSGNARYVNSPNCTDASLSNTGSCDHTDIATQTSGPVIFGSGTTGAGSNPKPGPKPKPPTFGSDQVLPGGQGAEPSIAVDISPTATRGNIYVSAIGDPNGPLEWHSYDGGQAWSQPVPYDLSGPLRGGDQDIAVNTNGDLLASDLNVSWSSVQISKDGGQTFDAGTQSTPEADRQWLTANGQNVYLAYHDFVAELPVVCTSFDGGNTFPLCNQAFGPNSPVSACAENTIPARALTVDPTNYALSFLYSCSTAGENAQHPPYGPLHDYYLAQSTDGGLTWSSYPVFIADTSGGKAPNYANIFGTLAVDSAGNYYGLFAGTADDNNADTNPYHVYLVTSTDHGHTWTAPVQVDQSATGTKVLPHLAVTAPGNVDVVWYGSSYTGEPNGVCGTLVSQSPCTDSAGNPDGFPAYSAADAPAWNVYLAQSTDALSASPSFTQVVADPTVTHYGEICTNGLVCGSSDRSLLDYISVGVDCQGYAHITFGGNTKAQEAAGETYVHVVNQTSGQALQPPALCGSPVP